MNLRVGIRLPSDKNWTGGFRYIENLTAAVSESKLPVEFVLVVDSLENQQPDVFENYEKVKLCSRWKNRYHETLGMFLNQKDYVAEKTLEKHNINIIFQVNEWYGPGFSIPTIAWIPDFQFAMLPEAFSPLGRWLRSLKVKKVSRVSTSIMLSSQSAARDSEQILPQSALSKVKVVPFAVKVEVVPHLNSEPIIQKYDLPEEYIFFPGQFWAHKNHLFLFDALRNLSERGINIPVVLTGSTKDTRHPELENRLQREMQDLVQSKVLYPLGLIPRDDLESIFQRAKFLINPSLFEGWSTTVEEAKAIGLPRILSNIKVHAEQSSDKITWLFDPRDSESLESVLIEVWTSKDATYSTKESLQLYEVDRKRFAENFFDLLTQLCQDKYPENNSRVDSSKY